MVLSREEAIAEMKKPLEYEFIGKESDFEQSISESIEEICALLGLPAIIATERQKLIAVSGFQIKPDIMVRHVDGTMTVFEVKKANEKYPSTGPSNQMGAIGQLLLYGNILSAIIESDVRLALIDNKIYYRTYCAFVGYKLPITLIEYQNDRIFVPYNGWRG